MCGIIKVIRAIIYGILTKKVLAGQKPLIYQDYEYDTAPALTKRGSAPGLGDCTRHPLGYAPLWDAHDEIAFLNATEYSDLANNAPTPANYVKIFEDYNSTVKSPFYLHVHSLTSYDPVACADYCGEREECKAFNVYVERFPTLDPGPKCPNPPATAHFRCALYGEPVQEEQAINYGELQPPADKNGEAFAVLMRGSNAYNKVPSDYNDGPTITFVQRVYATDVPEAETVTITATPGAVPETITVTVVSTRTRKVHGATRTVTNCRAPTKLSQHTLL